MGVQVFARTGAEVLYSDRRPEINRNLRPDSNLWAEIQVGMKVGGLNIIQSQENETWNEDEAERAQDGARHVGTIMSDSDDDYGNDSETILRIDFHHNRVRIAQNRLQICPPRLRKRFYTRFWHSLSLVLYSLQFIFIASVAMPVMPSSELCYDDMLQLTPVEPIQLTHPQLFSGLPVILRTPAAITALAVEAAALFAIVFLGGITRTSCREQK
ncbi:hypothetical protein B0H19DRAFT_1234865 [Mycena capillaripes]|nr:hypothetical protein B0H19DRAFT_1234865 [Mycena capillaripes]